MEFFEQLAHEFHLPLQNPVLVFSLILLIILLAPMLLKRVGIPGIIGLILSGVLIGPHSLNLLARNSAVDLFSTIGLLYIMFIAGLELDMNEFRAHRNKSLLFGLFTFIVPIAIGFPVCFYLLGYSFNASLLTASMFATHTLVAYPIVSKMGISKNVAVATTVGGTILTDTAVLIILAVIMGNNAGTMNATFWFRLSSSLVVFSAIMFVLVPRVAKWFFRKMESEKHAHYVFVLLIVFLAAFLAELAGVEPIIGAFVAGLALNRLVPHSSALMNRIEFIGNAIFIPFFLISVGMLVDVRVILSGPAALMIALTLSAVALSSKWLAAWMTQKTFSFSVAQRQLVFGLSSAHAAATLAVILVAYKAGILDENILNGTIILILITCVVASFATERAAKAVIVEADGADDAVVKTPAAHQEQILLPVVNPANAEKLVEFATLIREKKSTKPLAVLTVVYNDADAEKNIQKARQKLEDVVKQGAAAETPVSIVTTIDQNSAMGIARMAKEVAADLIVMGWKQRSGLLKKLMGEKTESILGFTEKTTFICQFQKPWVLVKRVVVVVPPLAEHENGFNAWTSKIFRLAQELNLPVHFYGTAAAREALTKTQQVLKINLATHFHLVEGPEYFFANYKSLSDDDLIVLVAARRGSPSHTGLLDNLPSKMEKYFPAHNKMIIYPQHFLLDSFNDRYDDFSADPLHFSIETMQKIGKGLGGLFKK